MTINPPFGSWLLLGGFLILTFMIANGIAAYLSKKRADRIVAKSEALASTTSLSVSGRTPVTIVTGFLGSGKTTLVNRMLREPGGRRIAVIENEVGAISIDHDLLKAGQEGRPAKDVFVLKNGCVCCTASSDGNELEHTLDVLLKLSESGPEGFNYVVIECSGLADPAPVIQLFFRPDMAKSRFALDGVLCVVDAKHIAQHLRPVGPSLSKPRTIEAEKQIASADVILMNKTDLVTASQLDDVISLVRHVNSSAIMHHCVQANVALNLLLNIKAYDIQTVRGMKPLMEPCCDHTGALSHAHTPHVTSVSLSSHHPLSLPRLQSWLQQMINANWQDLFRIKGILHIAGDNRRFVVHGVHAELIGDFEPLPHERVLVPSGDGDGKLPSAPASPVVVSDTESRMVVIGRNLDASSLQERFLSCVAHDSVDTSDEEPKPAKSAQESKTSRLRRRAD